MTVRPRLDLYDRVSESPALLYTLKGVCLVPRSGLSAHSSVAAEVRFSPALNLDAFSLERSFMSSLLLFSVALELCLFLLPLLSVDTREALATTAAPRARHPARVPTEV
jgi:hypothetical protein